MKFHTAVLQNFTKTAPKPGQKSEIFVCKYCNANYAKNTTRMCTHLLQHCRACPEAVKKNLKQITKELRKGRTREDEKTKTQDVNLLTGNLGNTFINYM